MATDPELQPCPIDVRIGTASGPARFIIEGRPRIPAEALGRILEASMFPAQVTILEAGTRQLVEIKASKMPLPRVGHDAMFYRWVGGVFANVNDVNFDEQIHPFDEETQSLFAESKD